MWSDSSDPSCSRSVAFGCDRNTSAMLEDCAALWLVTHLQKYIFIVKPKEWYVLLYSLFLFCWSASIQKITKPGTLSFFFFISPDSFMFRCFFFLEKKIACKTKLLLNISFKHKSKLICFHFTSESSLNPVKPLYVSVEPVGSFFAVHFAI